MVFRSRQRSLAGGLLVQDFFFEGEVICNCSALWYTSKTKLQEMLSHGGNKFLLDRLVAVEGLLLGDTDETAAMYGALVGAAGYAQHYHGLRKGGPTLSSRLSRRMALTTISCSWW